MQKEDEQPLVCVIDSGTVSREAYQATLAKAGYSVMAAESAREALRQIKNSSREPTVILVAQRMPDLDGIGFLQAYQPLKRQRTAVIMLCDYDAHKDINEAYTLGVRHCVLKARTAPRDLLELVGRTVQEIHL